MRLDCWYTLIPANNYYLPTYPYVYNVVSKEE